MAAWEAESSWHKPADTLRAYLSTP